MRHLVTPTLAAFALLAAPVAAQGAAQEPARDTDGKITDRRHPDYVKCRTESVVGSRAKKRRVCLTNAQWAEVARQGNGMAAALVEGGQSGIDWEAAKMEDQTCNRVIC